MLLDNEIAEERSVEHMGLKVRALNNEFVRVTHVCKTIPLRIWRISTADHVLECASKHLIVKDKHGPIAADQLRVGDVIITTTGVATVNSILDLGVTRECFDLRVESEDHLYFTGGILSHNSTGLGATELFKFNTFPNYHTIYLTPLKEHSKTIADKLQQLQRGSIYPPSYYTSRGYRNNLYYKESPMGGSLKLMHILTDPTKIRGNSAQTIVIDECVVTGTLITTYDSAAKRVEKAVEKLETGDTVLAHDKQHRIIQDTVLRVTNKGTRPTWIVTLTDGRFLACTSNEKIRTTKGWVFLSQLLPPAEVALCPRAQQVHAAIERAERSHRRKSAGRLIDADARESTPETIHDTRGTTRTLLESQSGSSSEFYSDTPALDGESRLWNVELRRFNAHDSSLRFLTEPLLPEGPKNKTPSQASDSTVGRNTNTSRTGLLVYGRRNTPSQSSPLHDAQLHTSRVRNFGGQTEGDGIHGGAYAADSQKQQDLPFGSDPYSECATIPAGYPALRSREYDLQVGTTCELPTVSLLSRRVRDRQTRKSSAINSLCVLHEGHMPKAETDRPENPGSEFEEKAPTAYERACARYSGSYTEGNDAHEGSEDARASLLPGWQEGEAQPDAQTLETEAQSGGYCRETDAAAHMPILRAGVLQLQQPQDGQTESSSILPSERMQKTGGRSIQGNSQEHSQREVGKRPFGDLVPVEIESITYAGEQEVFDIETENHHTFFAGGVAVHNCQDFDPEHIPEISMVQKAFPDSRMTVFAGTSKGVDTCLDAQYKFGSQGVWHVKCSCPEKYHSMYPSDTDSIRGLISVDGLRCPITSNLLDVSVGEFVHADRSRLALNMPSFHLPQVIVPEYSRGDRFVDIWTDFKKWKDSNFGKFLMEVWGIAVETGRAEITERDLMNCCTDLTFAQTQANYFAGKKRYVKVVSGVDWGGSDWEPAYRSKLSYTVHSIWGVTMNGHMDLLYANRYAEMNYKDVAGSIVEHHNKFQAFAMGTDNGGGHYYNAYMRDCGRIRTNTIIQFTYTDTKLMLARIPHPEAHLMSLHRSDSISALLEDIKSKKITWPRWDESSHFAKDCLNVRRNITETPAGKSIMRFIKPGSKADDFMMSMNYAAMMKRIILGESTIPNQQIINELQALFGLINMLPAEHTALDMIQLGTISG